MDQENHEPDLLLDFLKEIENYAKQNNVSISNRDNPLNLTIGFESSDHKIWEINIADIKKSKLANFFTTLPGRQLILDRLNQK